MALLFQVTDHIATLTINRPEKANALDRATVRELEQAWTEVRNNNDIWVAIITGAGDRAFCSGADLADPMQPADMEEVPGGIQTRQVFDLKGINIWKPIVAAVNGHAMGSGMEMLTGTDIRIAAEHATFALPEVRYGFIPYGGSLARLVRQVSYCNAMRLLLTGARIDAKEALRIGLVNEVVAGADVLPRARAITQEICQHSPFAVRAIKEAVVRGLNGGLDQAYVIESLMGERVLRSEDMAEAAKAFQEKRKPKFKGR